MDLRLALVFLNRIYSPISVYTLPFPKRLLGTTFRGFQATSLKEHLPDKSRVSADVHHSPVPEVRPPSREGRVALVQSAEVWPFRAPKDLSHCRELFIIVSLD